MLKMINEYYNTNVSIIDRPIATLLILINKISFKKIKK